MPKPRAPRGAIPDERQIPLITPSCSWRPPAIADLPQDWNAAGRVAVDCETRDDHLTTLGPGVRRGGYIVGVSFALENGPKHYLPFRHQGGDNLDPDQCLGYLRDQLKNFTGELAGTNLGYDLDYLWEAGCHTPQVSSYRDVQVAEPLLNEQRLRYGLDYLGREYFDEGKDDALMREAAACYGMQKPRDLGKWIWRLPGRYVGAYAEQDVDLPLRLLQVQEAEIAGQGLHDIYDLECRLLPVLVRMRRRGIRWSDANSERAERELTQHIGEGLALIRDRTGVVLSMDDLTDVHTQKRVLDYLGVDVPNTPKTNEPSIDKELLAGCNHEVTDALMSVRSWHKCLRDYVLGWRRFVTNGRVHATLNQMIGEDERGKKRGAAYGRMSCEEPNLQQAPGRDPVAGPLVRGQFVPEEGALWCCNDYSQQEPRWITHFAELMDLPRAREAAERYRTDPTTDNHQMMAEITGLPRKDAKIIYLALCYGEGDVQLCRDLGLPTQVVRKNRFRSEQTYLKEVPGEEGQRILDQFDQEVPYVRKLAQEASKTAGRRGYVLTVLGRRCRFPTDNLGNYDWTHKALNRVIQGSSGDQTKRALVEVDAAGHFLQLQVHDETDGSVADRKEARAWAEIMQDVVPARVPFLVDTELGDSWGTIQ